MLCNEASPQLVDYVSGDLSDSQRTALTEHLDGCASCQTDLASIHQWHGKLDEWSAVWQDETPPAWQVPSVRSASPDFWQAVRTWFPTAASTAALVIVTIMFVQQPSVPNGILPSGQGTPVDFSTLPELPQATQAAMVQSVLEGSRDERGQELQALLKILKAEMDKRSIETEESLRYIISHQIQGQQELDELYNQVEALMTENTVKHPAVREVSP